MITKVFRIILKPLLTYQAIAIFFSVKTDLSTLPIKSTLQRAQDKNISVENNLDWQHIDWILRVLCRLIPSVSPCLCHAIGLFTISPPLTTLLIYVKKNESLLSAHAGIKYQGQIFSLASTWHSEIQFLEIIKDSHAN